MKDERGFDTVQMERDFEELIHGTLRPVVTAVTALYVGISVTQGFLNPNLRTVPVLALAVSTVLLLVTIRFILARITDRIDLIESVGAGIAALVILNGAVHLYLFGIVPETRSLALMGLGILCYFLSSARLLLVLAVFLGIWTLLSWSSGTTEPWLHFAFGLFAATGLRIYTDLRDSRLRFALTSAKQEIQKREAVEEALRTSEERYALVARATKDGLWDWDLKEDVVFFSYRWKGMLGFYEDEIGDAIEEWYGRIHPKEQEKVRGAVAKHLEGDTSDIEVEYRIRCKDGEYRWMLSRGMAARDTKGKAYRLAGSQSDIDQRKRTEKRLLYQALHDPLTRLPNRALFIDRLKGTMDRAKRREEKYLFAVVFLDLDRFKVINDSLGHTAGDALLKAIARRLRECLREVDTIARFGGDEFAILLDDVSQPADITRCVERVHERLQQPFSLAGREVFVNASIGIVASSPRYKHPQEMLRDADTAMYRAKLKGDSKTEIFDKKMHAQAVATLQMENNLRVALRDEQFRLHFQPIISLRDGRVTGCEALLRWEHPSSGLLTPGRFLETAEDTGLIVPIGWWVLKRACQTMSDWHRMVPGAKDLAINVNVSAKQFFQADILHRVEEALGESGLEPGCLSIEITEDSVLHVGENLREVLKQLRSKGVEFHLDDFGTGYSSLAYLSQLPLDVTKVDRNFMAQMEGNRDNPKIVGTLINLIHDLGTEVLLEGIETRSQLEFVKVLGCEYAQGYYISRPLDEDEMRKWLMGLDKMRFDPSEPMKKTS